MGAQVTTEQRYRSARCQHERRIERSRFLSLWQAIVTPISRLHPASVRDTHNLVLLSHALQLAYIYNPKAAHSSVVEMIKALSPKRKGGFVERKVEQLGNVQPGNRPNPSIADVVPKGYTIATFVRDPLTTFCSGYAEAVWRLVAPKVYAGRHEYSARATYPRVDCTASDANSTRFTAFVEDVRARHRLGYDTYHAWPQVVKLDVLPENSSFDFIGRVETLSADFDRLLHFLKRGNKSVVQRFSNPATHQVDQCARSIRVPSEALQKSLPELCAFLHADYTCFGYTLPDACAPLIDASSTDSSVRVVSTSEVSDVVMPCSSWSAQLWTRRACFDVTALKHGTLAANDRSYPFVYVPPQLEGALFFRPSHKIRFPEDFTVALHPAPERASVWVWWNNNTGHARPMLPAGFTFAGRGPRYSHEGIAHQAVREVGHHEVGVSEMWVYRFDRRISRAELPTISWTTSQLRMKSRKGPMAQEHLTMGVAVTADCGQNEQSESRCPRQLDRTHCGDPDLAHCDATRAASLASLNNLSRRLQASLAVPGAREKLLLLRPLTHGQQAEPAERLDAHPVQCPQPFPFGAVLLDAFQAHLDTFGSPLGGASLPGASVPGIRSKESDGASASKESNGASLGYINKVVHVHVDEEEELRKNGMAASAEGVVLRTLREQIGVGAVRLNYCTSLYNAYTQWMAGELDISPRVRGVWFNEAINPMATSSLIDRWLPLVNVLADAHAGRAVPGYETLVSVVPKLLDLIETLTMEAGLIHTDIKPREILVRRMGGRQWDSRLTDLDGVNYGHVIHHQSNGQLYNLPLTNINYGQLNVEHPACRMLVSVQLAIAMFACGPLRAAAVAKAFVKQGLERVIMALNANGVDHPEGSFCGTAIGSQKKTIFDNNRSHTSHELLRAVHASGGTCPEEMTWENTGAAPPEKSSGGKQQQHVSLL